MSRFEWEGNPRGEPLLLKPTTLPHGEIHQAVAVADGGGGEAIGLINEKFNTPTVSLTDLVRTVSQTSQTQSVSQTRLALPAVINISLRITFYLCVLVVTLGLTLAACKFTNIWDPCEHLYVNSTECKVTSYMKGMIYYTECTEERYCILPGFESNIKRHGWSLHQPSNDNDNDASPNQILISSENPLPVLDM